MEIGEGVAGFEKICRLTLTCMQDNEVGEGGAVALARALEHNFSITTLGLEVRGGEGRREGTCEKTLLCDIVVCRSLASRETRLVPLCPYPPSLARWSGI